MASLDRNIPSVEEVKLLFMTLADFDDIDESATLPIGTLTRELTAFAKKVNTRDLISAGANK